MSDFQDILDSVEVEEWLDDQGLDYKKVGSDNLKLDHCPWCEDSDRVYISTNKKVGLCFKGSCGQKFNLFTYARQHLNLNNRETVEHFKSFVRGAYIPVTPPVVNTPVKTHTASWKLPESVCLPTPQGTTHPALEARGITLATQEKFQLRWCEQGHFSYKDHYENNRQQDFSQRIIIPVYDLDGTLQTFQGRATWDVNEDYGERRYLFPIGLPGTGRFLYGGELLNENIDTLVIAEGPFDTMAIDLCINNDCCFNSYGVVGSFGLSISHSDEDGNDQLGRLRQLKSKGLKTIIICWDGEYNAHMAALEAAKLLHSDGFVVKIALIPDGKDPNECSESELAHALAYADTFNSTYYVLGKLNPPYKPNV